MTLGKERVEMRKVMEILVICMLFLMVSGNFHLKAAEQNYISEQAFANQLNTVSKVGATHQTGRDTLLTRGKAAQMIVNYLNATAIAKSLEDTSHFSDVTESKGAIELVYQLGIMHGVSEALFAPDAQVTVEAAQNVIMQLNSKLQTPTTWRHACYAINSSGQMDLLNTYQAVSFGWAEVIHKNGSFDVSLSEGNFKLPSGFEMPIDYAKANGVETYLMVYWEPGDTVMQSFLGNAQSRKALIDTLILQVNGVTKDGVTREFDGITIDFEGLKSSAIQLPYVQFLKELKARLMAQNKKLNIAVQPTLYYKGYDYKGIGEAADHIILMAHDYGSQTLSLQEQQQGITTTPITPIKEVYTALKEAKNAIGDTSKIALQFSFGSLQWQKQSEVTINSKAYTPSYDKIEARLMQPNTKVYFDTYSQDTYATYDENGIINVIWYEDANSITAKMEIARLLGITSFSYWRLGTIPKDVVNLI